MTKTCKRRRGPSTITTPEIRKQICDLYNLHNWTVKNICERYKMADKTIRDIIKRFDKEGTVHYKPRGGVARKAQLKEEHEEFLRIMVDETEDETLLTLNQLREHLYSSFPYDFLNTEKNSALLSLATLSRHVDKKLVLNLKRKKQEDESLLLSLQDQHRIEFYESLKKHEINDVVFVDKSDFSASMVYSKARSMRNTKSNKPKPIKHISIIGAMSLKRIESMQVVMIDKATDKFIFALFVENLLAWLDDEYGRPMCVLMDTDRLSPKETIENLFEKSQHTCLFLPLCPVLNPMEIMFNNLVHFVKRSPDKNDEGIADLIQEAKHTIQPKDCECWINQCINHMTDSESV